MTDAEYRKQKKRIRRLIKRWYRALGLGWWLTHHEYIREGIDGSDRPGGSSVLARCHADWRYREATIRWSMPDVARQDDEELDGAFVHEMVHLFVNSLREGVRDSQVQAHHDHEELVCTQLAWAIVWTRKAGREDAVHEEATKANTRGGARDEAAEGRDDAGGGEEDGVGDEGAADAAGGEEVGA